MPKIIFHDSEGVDRTVTLGADQVLIGRANECQIQTQDAMVSRRHARITWDGNYWVEDLGSSNGVYVGHERVQKAPFRIGDTVTCGSLVLKMVPDTAPRQTSSTMPVSGGGTPPFGADAMPGVPMGAPPPVPSYGAPPPAPPPPSYGAPPPLFSGGPPSTVAQMPTVPPPMPMPPSMTAPQPAVGGGSGVALADLDAEKRRRMEAEDALLAAEERCKVAEARATEAEASAKESNILRRKVDQMTADLKRLRGGQPLDDNNDARFAAEAERDQLRARVADLERRVGSSGSSSSSAPADDGEKDKLRRQVDQLNAEIKRMRTSQGGAAADAQRIAELTAELAKAQVSAKAGAVNAQAADLVVLLGDSLAELRGSLRAANDEAGMLTAPKESVDVISDSLRQAAEQLEQAREKIRQLAKMMGVG